LWACASLIAKSMTSPSLGLLHPAAPVTAELINCTSAQDAEKLRPIQGHWAPNIDHIHHSQNSYFKALSHPGIVRIYIDCTEIKHAGLCCDVWEFVFSPKTSENISSIDDDAEETYSLCSPSRPRDRVDSLDFFQCMKNFVLKNEERTKVLGNPNRPLSGCGLVDIKEIIITKSVLVLQDSTENWLNCRALFRVKFLSLLL